MEECFINNIQLFFNDNDFMKISLISKNFVFKSRRKKILKKRSKNRLEKCIEETNTNSLFDDIEPEDINNHDSKIDILRYVSNTILEFENIHVYDDLIFRNKIFPSIHISKYITKNLKLINNSGTMNAYYRIVHNYHVSSIYRLSPCATYHLKKYFRTAMALIY